MRKFKRLPEPVVLRDNWEEWGLLWEARQLKNPGARFQWRQVDNERINRAILPMLKQQTDDHCSFCDSYPVSPPGKDTVEHFKPKSKFPREAYHWANLYYCCDFCQQKGDDYEEELLRPDADDYEFDRYFRWDYTTGELMANESASPEDESAARETIRLYRLNDGHPTFRKMQRRRWQKCNDEVLNDFPYRGFLE